MDLDTMTSTSMIDTIEKFLSLDGIEGSVAQPYIDSQGIPTVGVGINLSINTFSAEYMTILGVSPENRARIQDALKKPYPSDDLLRAALKEANGGIELRSLNSTEIATLYNDIAIGKAPVPGGAATTYQSPDGKPSIYASFAKYLEKNHIDSAILGSREGIALLSLYFNAPTTLGKNITKSLIRGNDGRADDWFEIRYGTNKGALTNDPTSGPNGVASRRDMESAIFGLYDPSNTEGPSLAEALNIFASFSETLVDAQGKSHTHRDWAFEYESIYSARASVGDAKMDDPSLVGTPIAGLSVESLEESLRPAAQAIVEHYVLDRSLNPFLGAAAFSMDDFSPLDIQIAGVAGGTTLTASHRDGYLLVDANGRDYNNQVREDAKYYDSLLIAQGGSVTLDGSGSADNVLIGGWGEDVIKSGSGNDYIVAGTGSAQITLGGGDDTVVLGVSGTSVGAGSDTVDATHSNGSVSYYIGAGSDVTIRLGDAAPAAISIVDSIGAGSLGQTALTITAMWISSGVWYDFGKQAMVRESLVYNPATGALEKSLRLIYQTQNSHNPAFQAGSNRSESSFLSSVLDFFVSPASADELSKDQIRSLYAGGNPSGSTTTVITLENVTDDGISGVELGDAPTTGAPGTGLQIDASNSFTPGILAATEFDNSTGAAVLIGPAVASDGVWAINGLGRASSIYGGTGKELIVADSRALGPNGTEDTSAVYIQAGSGAQTIIGGQGDDTLIGGETTVSSVTVEFEAGSGPLGASAPGGYSMTGKAGFDWITAGGGDSLIQAGTGDTLIEGGLGADTIIGGSGNDTIYAGLSNYAEGLGDAAIINLYDVDGVISDTWLTGIAGSQLPGGGDTGTAKANLIIAGSGNTLIFGGLGDDTIYGGSGDDTIVGNAGNKTIYGGTGHSVIYADENAALERTFGIAWMDAGSEYSDTIYGGGGDGTIFGSGGHNEIHVGGGDMVVNLGNGDSYVDASTGNVTIVGGAGQSIIDAGTGDDLIELGEGSTFVYAGLGDTTILGGNGNDTIEAGGGNTAVIAGTGSTTFIVGSGTGTATLQPGGAGINVQLVGGLGEDELVVRHVSNDLVLTDQYSNTQLTISGYFGTVGQTTLTFQDGTIWGAADILLASMKASNGGDDTLVGTGGDDSIEAGIGNTYIVSSSGNNTLVGGMGDDTIEGGSGTDTIVAGTGTTYVIGGSGAQTYIFNADAGSETIVGSSGGPGMDTMLFGPGITASDVSVSHMAGSDDIVLSFGGATGSTLALLGFMSALSNRHQITSFQFADGTTLTRDQVLQKAVAIYGTAGSNRIYGTAGADFIDGLGGGDSLYGEGGNDTYVFNRGYGSLTIGASTYAPNHPVLQLGEGISLASLDATIHGSDLLLTDGVSGDVITLTSMGGSSGSGVSSVRLADGTELTRTDLIRLQMIGTTGGESIIDTSGDDLIDGRGGADIINATGGNDTFVYQRGYGNLTIYKSSAANSVLQLGAGILKEDLKATTNGTNMVITDGLAGDAITLANFWTSNSGVASIKLEDGTVLTRAQMLALEMQGTSGNDSIRGTSSADTLDGRGGSDTLIGGGGSDTFIFNAGYGQLDIYDTFSGQYPVLQMGEGIAASSLKAKVATLGDLLITDGIDGDSITIRGITESSTSGIAAIRLADGTILTRAQLMQMALTGTVGNDHITGTRLADLIDGKGGDDSVNGQGGNDTFVFNRGYGSLDITDSGSPASGTLQMGESVGKSDIRVSTDGSDLIVRDGTAGDVITLERMWEQDGFGVGAVKLYDGTVLSRNDLLEMELIGTEGDDVIFGIDGSHLLDGRGGNDTIRSKSGSADTIVFKKGYGHLQLSASHDKAAPVLSFGEGISASSLEVRSDGRDLEITDGVSGDEVRLTDVLLYQSEGVAEISLADGTVLTIDELVHMELAGTGGDDTIYGTWWSDLLDGKGGNDHIEGHGGTDTFVFNQGYGHLTLDEYGPHAILTLGAGITTSNIRLEKLYGDSFYISDGIAGDQIVMPGASNSYIDIVFADGTVWAAQDLASKATNLVNGGLGYDNLIGTSGNDFMDGMGGSDYVYGLGGNDTVVIKQGYGNTWVHNARVDQTTLLQFGDGIRVSDLRPTGDMSNLYLHTGVVGDEIKIDELTLSPDNSLNLVRLSNNKILTVGQLVEANWISSDAITGTETGNARANIIYGEFLADKLVGGGGNDTFVLSSGYRDKELDNSYAAGEVPVVELDRNIQASDLSISTNGSDIFINDGHGDVFTIDGMYSDQHRGVTSVNLADGTVLSADDLRQAAAHANSLVQAMAAGSGDVGSSGFVVRMPDESQTHMLVSAHG